MKKHDFTIFIVIASLLMCGAAWLVKNRLLPPRAVRTEGQAQVMLPTHAPLDGFEVIEPYGAVFDEAFSEWRLREETLLRGALGAFGRMPMSGVVVDCQEDEAGWRVAIELDSGGVLRLGGLRAPLAVGQRVEQGDMIGQLKSDTLSLSAWDADGMAVDAFAMIENS